jgi:NADPH:quinone reductase-like Zn-dependent oxidoreductase
MKAIAALAGLPGPHGLLLRVEAVAVNPVDTELRQAQARRESGHTIGKLALEGWV